MADTIRGQGNYEIVDGNVLLLPVESEIFDFRTLGFTADLETLELITQALEYEYQGFYTLDFYLVLHMIRDEEDAD